MEERVKVRIVWQGANPLQNNSDFVRPSAILSLDTGKPDQHSFFQTMFFTLLFFRQCFSSFESHIPSIESSKSFPKQALVFTCLQYKSFEYTVSKGEIAHNKQFLLFPQCFLPFWITLHHSHQIQNNRLQALSLEASKI